MNQLTIHADQPGPLISRHIYGHFAEHLGRCIYEGFWVGEDSKIPNVRGIRQDVVAALRTLDIPNLRWPGGCFADEYHWMDGIGPREARATMINTHWGGVIENNHFGTHEFFDLCEMLGTEAYVCGNVGSGSVAEMADWVEYITHPGGSRMADLRQKNGRQQPWKLPFFGVGNESWGCGGNMRPQFYADQYRRYQTFVRQFGEEKIYKIACGANDSDYAWTRALMESAANLMDGLSLHHYTIGGSWENKGNATNFGLEEYFATLAGALKMDELIARHSTIMDEFDPAKRVGLIVDEWGTWWDADPNDNRGILYQQNTQRDALVAALTLNIFNARCDRVKMANIAQTANVLQAMVLTQGAQMILTPTYHVFEMWKSHQDAQLLPHFLKCDDYTRGAEANGAEAHGAASMPALSVSASRRAGAITLTIAHCDPRNSADLTIELRGADGQTDIQTVVGRVLGDGTIGAHNTFEAPATLAPRELAADAIKREGDRFTLTLPPTSITALSFTAS